MNAPRLPDEQTRIAAVLSGDRSVWSPPVARPASTVALVRDSPQGLTVYLIKRAPTVNFPAVTAYPGGGHEPGDGDEGDERTALRAAIRELREETSVVLDEHAPIVPFARWVTPETLPVRFDTHFFAAALPVGAEPRLVGTEAVTAGWWSPAEVLQRRRELGLMLLPPTLATLSQLAQFDSVTRALAGIRPPHIGRYVPRPTRGARGVQWEVVDTITGSVVATGDTLAEL